MVLLDGGGGFEVGDGAGHLEDAVVGAGAHVEALHGIAELLEAGGVGLGPLVQQRRGHLRVTVHAAHAPETLRQYLAGGHHAGTDGTRRLAGGLARHLPTASVGCASAMLKRVWHCARLAQQLVEVDGLHLHLQVDAVEHRAADFAHIVRTLVFVAHAGLLGMAVVAARARVHTRHEHERGGVLGGVAGSRNRYHAVLKRLPHHLEHRPRELRQFVKKKDSVMCQ